LTSIFLGNGIVTNNFESWPTKDNFSSNFLSDFDVIFFIICPSDINFMKKTEDVERKISQKNPEYMLNHSMP
jgi:hypothetical protein